MNKLKIVLYHLGVFVVGSIGIAVYTLLYFTSPASNAGLGGVFALPAIVLIYLILFGILCAVSLVIWLLVALVHDRRR